MPRIQTAIHVTSPATTVMDRFNAAAEDPSLVISWFTSDNSVTATVEPIDDRSWSIGVTGPGFGARGTGSVGSRPDGSHVDIDLDIKPRGLFGTAAVLAAVVSGQVESEIRKTLWREFGRPGENHDQHI